MTPASFRSLKTCSQCGVTYPASPEFFSRRKRSSDGLVAYCKECQRKSAKAYRASHPDGGARWKAWDANNPERSSAAKASWIASNKERYRELQNQWAARNPEKVRAFNKATRLKSASKIRAHNKAWRAANPDRVAAIHLNRRARKSSADGRISSADIELIFDKQKGRCSICLTRITRKSMHRDHIVPLARGGSNWPTNFQLTCKSCNLRKGHKDPFEFANLEGRLL